MQVSKAVQHIIVAATLAVGSSASGQDQLQLQQCQQLLRQLAPLAVQPLQKIAPKGGAIAPFVPEPSQSRIEDIIRQTPGGTEAAKAAPGIEKAATDAAKKAAELPAQAAKEGIKLTLDAASELFKQVTDIIQKAIDGLEEKAKAKLLKLWEDVKLYVYAAAAILFAILVTPAIISSIVTVWLVRLMDRRRERRAAL
jgi:hypothetical protein